MTPSQRPRGPRDPQNGHAFPQDHSRMAHTPLTRAPRPHAQTLATLPPCHTHETSSNSTSPARSAWMTACGSAPNSRELFQHRGAFLHSVCSCNASHQLQSESKNILSSATRPRKDNASFRYAGRRRTMRPNRIRERGKRKASGEIAEEEAQPRQAAEAQAEGVSSTEEIGGRHRTRTYDPLRVKQVL